MFESTQKENRPAKGEAEPAITREALEKAQEEFNRDYRAWLHAPKGSKSAVAPKLKEYIARAAGAGEESRGAEETPEEAPEKRAVEVDMDAFKDALRRYYLEPAGKKKPEPGDFPLEK